MEKANPSTNLYADEAEIRRVVDGIDDAVDAKDWESCRGYFADEIYQKNRTSTRTKLSLDLCFFAISPAIAGGVHDAPPFGGHPNSLGICETI